MKKPTKLKTSAKDMVGKTIEAPSKKYNPTLELVAAMDAMVKSVGICTADDALDEAFKAAAAGQEATQKFAEKYFLLMDVVRSLCGYAEAHRAALTMLHKNRIIKGVQMRPATKRKAWVDENSMTLIADLMAISPSTIRAKTPLEALRSLNCTVKAKKLGEVFAKHGCFFQRRQQLARDTDPNESDE
jgi:hypothetical protein